MEQFELQRAALSNWVDACGLPKAALQRWTTSPVHVASPPMRLPNGTVVPSAPEERAALAALSALSEAVMRSTYTPGRLFDDVVAAARAASAAAVGVVGSPQGGGAP
jgi:hypothetical protein